MVDQNGVAQRGPAFVGITHIVADAAGTSFQHGAADLPINSVRETAEDHASLILRQRRPRLTSAAHLGNTCCRRGAARVAIGPVLTISVVDLLQAEEKSTGLISTAAKTLV